MVMMMMISKGSEMFSLDLTIYEHLLPGMMPFIYYDEDEEEDEDDGDEEEDEDVEEGGGAARNVLAQNYMPMPTCSGHAHGHVNVRDSMRDRPRLSPQAPGHEEREGQLTQGDKIR
jgi:hypothetical protein